MSDVRSVFEADQMSKLAMSSEGYKVKSSTGWVSEYDSDGNFIDAYRSQELIDEWEATQFEIDNCAECSSETGNPCTTHG